MTWYYNGTPTLNNLPAIEWETTTDKDNHIGDLYYDKATGHAYRFMYDNDTRSYVWTPIPDQDIAKALGKAQDAQDTADSKRRIFVRQPLNSEEYDVGDLWVNATYPSGNTTSDPTHGLYYNDILRCMTHKDADVAFSIAHWGLSSRYTDDSALTSFLAGYTSTLTGIRNDISAAQTSADNAAALAAAADYLKQAFLDNTGQAQTTDITGGLVLSTIVALRDANRKVWSGINGSYQENETGTGYKGHGIAAWYGGGMVDHEVTPSAQNYAKSLFRFDGSGYVASGNLTWDANGNVTLQGVSINAETLQKDGVGVATTNDLTSYLTKTDATNTYLSIAFFKRLFQAYNGTTAVNPNDTSTTIDSIKAMFGFWTEQYVSALGKNSSGGSGTTLTLNEPLASINNASLGTPSESGVGLVWDGTKWTFGRTSGSGDYLPLSGGMMSGVIRFGTGESNIVTYSGDAVTYNGETVTFGSGSGGSIYSATSSILAPTFSSLASMVIKSAWGISFADESDYIGAFVDVKNGILGVRTRLGIGTDSPTYPLHVSGTGFVSGTLTAGAFVRSSGTPSQFLKADGSVDSNAYATESWVTEKGYLTSASLDGYATQTWVTNKGYITPSALSGYATESWVTKKGYITASTLADYLPLTGGNITGNLNVSGSVGIGTTSPSYKLHVNGSLFSSGLTCSGGMAVSGAATLSSTLSVSGATTISNTLSVTGLITASGGITIPSGKTLTIGDAVLSWDSVNQGIKISKGVYSEIFVSALGANSSQGGSNISLNEPLASINSASLGTPSSSGMGLVWNGTKWTYQSVTGDSSSGTIQGNLYITGSVGIGTTPSIYKLHVMGTALVTGGTKLGSICIECDSNGANFSSTSGEINRYDSTLYLQYGTTANLSMCQGGGYVAIGGSVQNGIRLKVYGATQTRSLNVNGFEVFYENGGYEINTDGTKVTVDSTWYGTFQSSSDARLKNVIDYPSVSVEEIANAPIVNFKWFDNKDNDTHLGTIAQYWKSVTPHGVSQMPNGYLAMDYGAIALASAVSVAKRVLNLEERVRHLENENRILKEQLKAA